MSEEFEAGARSVERGYERTIERLERELAAAQAEIAARLPQAAVVAMQERYKAEIAALREDAERLDALESDDVVVRPTGDAAWEARRRGTDPFAYSSWHVAKTLRAAIDLARKG